MRRSADAASSRRALGPLLSKASLGGLRGQLDEKKRSLPSKHAVTSCGWIGEKQTSETTSLCPAPPFQNCCCTVA